MNNVKKDQTKTKKARDQTKTKKAEQFKIDEMEYEDIYEKPQELAKKVYKNAKKTRCRYKKPLLEIFELGPQFYVPEKTGALVKKVLEPDFAENTGAKAMLYSIGSEVVEEWTHSEIMELLRGDHRDVEWKTIELPKLTTKKHTLPLNEIFMLVPAEKSGVGCRVAGFMDGRQHYTQGIQIGSRLISFEGKNVTLKPFERIMSRIEEGDDVAKVEWDESDKPTEPIPNEREPRKILPLSTGPSQKTRTLISLPTGPSEQKKKSAEKPRTILPLPTGPSSKTVEQKKKSVEKPRKIIPLPTGPSSKTVEQKGTSAKKHRTILPLPTGPSSKTVEQKGTSRGIIPLPTGPSKKKAEPPDMEEIYHSSDSDSQELPDMEEIYHNTSYSSANSGGAGYTKAYNENKLVIVNSLEEEEEVEAAASPEVSRKGKMLPRKDDPTQMVEVIISEEPEADHDHAEPEVDYDLAFLTAQPLCWDYESKQKVLPPPLEFEEEQNVLVEVCRNAAEVHKRKIRYMHAIGTHGNFTDVILQKTKMLHYSGNGSDSELLLETECDARNVGETTRIEEERLRVLTKKGDVQFIFICSQVASDLAELFVDCGGVAHVVALNGPGPEPSEFITKFIRTFYRAIFSGKSIESAFTMAKETVANIEDYGASIDDLVQLWPQNADHSACLYPRRDGKRKKGEFINLTPTSGRDLNLGGVHNSITRTKLMIDVLGSVMKNNIVILQGSYGTGKTHLMRTVGHYLVKRRRFMKGILYFKFHPAAADPKTFNLAEFLDNQLEHVGSGSAKQRVRDWFSKQNPSGLAHGMLLLFDDIEKILIPDPSCAYIHPNTLSKNLSFFQSLLSVKGVKVLVTATNSKLEELLFMQNLNPTPIHVSGMDDKNSRELLFLNLEKLGVESKTMKVLRSMQMEIHGFLQDHVMETMSVGRNKEFCGRPGRIRNVARDFAERLNTEKRHDEHTIRETHLKAVRKGLSKHFLDFWVGEMNNVEHQKTSLILEKFDLYIKRRCNTINRGLFWTIWDSDISELNQFNKAAKAELMTWFNHEPAISKEKFALLWEDRLHGIEAEIRHFGPDLWQKPGAIAGFWDKIEVQKILTHQPIGTFIVRFSRTFAHHVNIMCRDEDRIAKILICLLRNGKTLAISKKQKYENKETAPLESYILDNTRFEFVYNCARKEIEDKEHLFCQVGDPPDDRCDYTCCSDKLSCGGLPPKRSEIMKRRERPRLPNSGSGSYSHSHKRRYDGYREKNSSYREKNSSNGYRENHPKQNRSYRDHERHRHHDSYDHASSNGDHQRHRQDNFHDRASTMRSHRSGRGDRDRLPQHSPTQRRHRSEQPRHRHRSQDTPQLHGYASDNRYDFDSRPHPVRVIQESRSHTYHNDRLPQHPPTQRRHRSEQPRHRDRDHKTPQMRAYDSDIHADTYDGYQDDPESLTVASIDDNASYANFSSLPNHFRLPK